MVAKNDITGDRIVSRESSQAYLTNYGIIFGGGAGGAKPIEVEVKLPMHISGDGERLVSDECFMYTPEQRKPEKGVDMILITKGGKCTIGRWSDDDCIEYHPMPRRAKYRK